jgi:translation initiation factor 2B subunit (eIF-2B alpha/beta/delta family)
VAHTGIEQLRNDRRHGARGLTRRAATVLLTLARDNPSALPDACGELASAQPAMAPLVRLARAAGQARTVADVEALCLRTLNELERSGAAVAANAAALLGQNSTVLTHSSSGTVSAALAEAQARGIRFRVIATESQPLGEGVRLAETLQQAGISVTLIADDTVAIHLSMSSLVMVGADAVSPGGVVNKVGTAGIAALARERAVPFYVVCTSDKLVGEHDFYDPEHLYDVTPLDLVTAIVTEDGLLPRA